MFVCIYVCICFRFALDSSSGEVKINSHIDREIRNSYFLTIVAEDGGGHKNRTQLSINVTDVNDSPPTFLQMSYAANIAEDSAVFMPPLIVSVSIIPS